MSILLKESQGLIRMRLLCERRSWLMNSFAARMFGGSGAIHNNLGNFFLIKTHFFLLLYVPNSHIIATVFSLLGSRIKPCYAYLWLIGGVMLHPGCHCSWYPTDTKITHFREFCTRLCHTFDVRHLFSTSHKVHGSCSSPSPEHQTKNALQEYLLLGVFACHSHVTGVLML